MKSHHYIYLVLTILIVAFISGFAVYFTSIKLFIKENLPNVTTNNVSEREKEVVVNFVPVDPEAPIALPTGTVGGMTACERLDNLKTCLKEKNPSLFAQVMEKNATSGATIEERCGNTLSDINILRMESIKSGCIY